MLYIDQGNLPRSGVMHGLAWKPANHRHNCWVTGHFVYSKYADTYDCARHQVRYYNPHMSKPPDVNSFQCSQEWKRDEHWINGFRLIDHSKEHVPCP